MIDLVNLRKIAENATPGPWEKTQEYLTHPSGYDIEVPGGASVASECCGYTGSIGKREDAEFIATFNPEMVLALLDRVEKAEGELDLMEQALDLSKMVEDKIKKKLDRAEQALQRVREQHQVDEYTAGHTIVRCVCEEMWPCPTIKALEGDE